MCDTQLPFKLEESKLSVKTVFKNRPGKEDRNAGALDTFLQKNKLREILPQP